MKPLIHSCDPREARHGHGDCTDKESTSPEESDDSPSDLTGKENVSSEGRDDNSSDSVDTKDASSAKDGKDSKKWAIWESITWIIFLTEVVAIILVVNDSVAEVNICIMALGYALLFIGALATIWLVFEEERIPSHDCLPKLLKSLSELVSKHRQVVRVVWMIFIVVGEAFLCVAAYELGVRIRLIIMVYSLVVAFASGAVLFCWEVKGAEGARERAMGMATVASVAGIILAIATILISNQTLSDCVCESCSSNEVLVEAYQDESYS